MSPGQSQERSHPQTPPPQPTKFLVARPARSDVNSPEAIRAFPPVMTQNEAHAMASFPTPRVHEVRALTPRDQTSPLVPALQDAKDRRACTTEGMSLIRVTGGDS